MYSQPVFYKITNKHENHHGYQYRDGLNILSEPFNNNPRQPCVRGGFYFTTKEHLHKYLGYGVWIREVYLPTWDPNFQMVQDPTGDKWRANMIILGQRFHIFQMNMYLNAGLDVNKFINHPNFMPLVCRQGRTDVLDWIKCSRYYLFSPEQIYEISKLEMVPPNVLEWFKLNIPDRVNFNQYIFNAIENYNTATVCWLWNNRHLIDNNKHAAKIWTLSQPGYPIDQLYDYLKRMSLL